MQNKTKVVYRELANSVVCETEVEVIDDNGNIVQDEAVNKRAKELYNDASRFSALKTMEKTR